VNCAARPKPALVWPIRIRAGPFAENVPARDLYLAPDHAVFARGVLMPVKLLVNGDGIAQMTWDRVRYFHV
jgi:Hint domain